MFEPSAALIAFLERMKTLAGAPNDEACLAAARVTLGSLAGRLTRAERTRLAADLPIELRGTLNVGERGRESCDSLQAAGAPVTLLFADVARALDLPLGHATETAEVVCRVVAETIPEDVRALLLDHPARDLGELFSLPAEDRPRGETSRSRHAWTLAEATAGSRHPLSKAVPRAAHSGSVASWDPARTARTLGDYRGNAPGATLATGAPGSRHKLADSR